MVRCAHVTSVSRGHESVAVVPSNPGHLGRRFRPATALACVWPRIQRWRRYWCHSKYGVNPRAIPPGCFLVCLLLSCPQTFAKRRVLEPGHGAGDGVARTARTWIWLERRFESQKKEQMKSRVEKSYNQLRLGIWRGPEKKEKGTTSRWSKSRTNPGLGLHSDALSRVTHGVTPLGTKVHMRQQRTVISRNRLRVSINRRWARDRK